MSLADIPPGQPIALLNARLLDPASGQITAGGAVLADGLIADLGAHLRRTAPPGASIIDCADKILAPGLVDMQVFTGEPGQEHRETFATASRAAAAGGVTTIVCMPNTAPVLDDVSLVDFVERRARDTAIVRIHPMAAMTRGLEGTEMTEIGLLKAAGAVAFTNSKHSVASARVMRNLLTYARDFDSLICHHTEDGELARGGVMNEGEISGRLGMPGIPKAAEVIMVERDLRLVALSGGRYHAQTISCRESLDLIRDAKARGLNVSCGVSINHLTLNENDVGPYRTYFKLRPPLRVEEDRRAMVDGIADGTIDVIVSSHDPKDADVKRRPFEEAADGAIGLETLLAAALRLHHNNEVSLARLMACMTINPARLLGLPVGRLEKGAPADLVLFDPDAPWVVEPQALRSRSKNTPFDGARLQGRVLKSLVAGRVVYQYGIADPF